VVLAAALSGCGGDERTKADFVAEADALCGAANGRLEQLGALKPSMFTDSDARHALERWFSGFVQALDLNVEELRGLEQPAGEAEALTVVLFEPRERVLSHARETLALVRANGTPVASSRGLDLVDAIDDAQLPAAQYGFADCSEIRR
jgi:hypothetical protein